MQTRARSDAHAGFTLIEMMVTLTLAGILAGLAIPNMRTFLWNNRIAGTANDLLHAIQVARTEGIKRQPISGAPAGSAVVCATTDSSVADNALSCSYGNFSQWFTFYDANNNGVHDNGEPVLSRGAAAATNTVKSDNAGIVCFGPTGFANLACGVRVPTSNIIICDSRGATAVGALSTARALFVSRTGRARVSNLSADVTTSIAATGSCP